MRHRVKKIKFKLGKDSTETILKKLLVNFFTRGRLKTTLTRAKTLKPVVENLVEKMKEETQANHNYLLRYFGDVELFDLFYRNIGPALKDKTGGYVKIARLGFRDTDGAEITQVEWAYPIVIDNPKKEKKSGKKEKEDGKKDKETPVEVKKNKQ